MPFVPIITHFISAFFNLIANSCLHIQVYYVHSNKPPILSNSITTFCFKTLLFYVSQGTNRETRSIILTLAVCYHARIQERENFVQHICGKFEPPISKEEFVEKISMYV